MSRINRTCLILKWNYNTIMKKISDKRITLPVLFLIFSLHVQLSAQQKAAPGLPHQLTLQNAITLSKAQNKQIRAARSEENASDADLKDAKNAALPGIAFNGDYERFTK